MKRIGIVLAGVAAMAVGAGPLAAWAQRGQTAISNSQRDQGAAEAPAAVAASGVTCTVADAYFINSTTDPQTRAQLRFYEVACNEGLGYIVEQGPDAARAFDCITVGAQAGGARDALTCRLPANADPKQGLAPIVAASGRTCEVSDARPMGSTAAGDSFFEVACGSAGGYVIKTSPAAANAPPDVIDCVQLLDTDTQCELTSRETILANLGQQVNQGGGTCAVSQARYVGSTPTDSYYEVACGEAPGYMISVSNTGVFQQAIECSKAQSIGGGCTMTDVSVAEAEEAATYTGLARASGYDCEVSQYRFLGIDQTSQSEVVELACSNRPDGAVALFPTSGAPGTINDCIVSEAIGVTCNLSEPSAVFAKYTAGLATQGRTTCQVSGAKWLGGTTTGTDLIETACADGDPGYVMSVVRTSGEVTELLTCTQARNAGAACTFPTNNVTPR